jgi:penicillin amidase
MRQWHRVIVGAAVAGAAAIAALLLAVRGSLPAIEGRLAAPGLEAPVKVERDALGVATIAGSTRNDVAYATGFVHAQDRFFQMDLSRRMSAGRLAELVGDGALPTDRRNRLHRFEALAGRVYAKLSDGERELLRAYAAGVNAGLDRLRVRPFEYLLLRSSPERWQPRDTVLVVFAMYLQLNDSRAEEDLHRSVLKASLPPALFDFVNSVAPEWEAPIDGRAVAAAPMPGPDVYDLRGHARELTALTAARPAIAREARSPGSNNWALGGQHTASGAGLVANDMHLGLGVPNTWYRARLIVQGPQPRDLVGLTLPGTPLLVAGSNGRVAWGFTNSYGDYSDLVRVELSADGAQYRGATGYRPLAREREILRSSSGAIEVLDLRLTEWGPLLEELVAGEALALRWTAHEPDATNLRWLGLEAVDDVNAALALANTIGGPVQNFVCADARGNVGWTLLGRIPARGAGYDPTVPSDWTRPRAGWQGFLPPARYPRVRNPPDGRIWTANNRVVGAESLALIGDGAPDRGARARQIRDALAPLANATERDMLAIQLDDRALFLARWRELLLDILDADALAGHPDRAVLRDVVASGEPRASAASVGYLHLRRFHEVIEHRVFEALTIAASAAHPDADLRVPRQFEDAAWRLVTQRPAHLLHPRYASWREFLLSAVDETIATIERDCGRGRLASCSWGERNAVNIRHPLSRAFPPLARWLDMPTVPMAGDNDMPHVHQPGFGASERFAVSPGHEADGILHMPAGQSGHPWSPWYRAGHEAWVRGEPTPLLPGPAQHTLELVPGTWLGTD